MKRLLFDIIGVLGIVLGMAIAANAATLTWDRNTEADMKDYAVYACFVKNCTVVQGVLSLQTGFVPQPIAGVIPTYTLNLVGKEGAVAVSARDLTGNESTLSVQVPFDDKAPSAPINPHF
jgi:hypothetical protein